jgi:hypothetical protein
VDERALGALPGDDERSAVGLPEEHVAPVEAMAGSRRAALVAAEAAPCEDWIDVALEVDPARRSRRQRGGAQRDACECHESRQTDDRAGSHQNHLQR